jgi:hypothetical protein
VILAIVTEGGDGTEIRYNNVITTKDVVIGLLPWRQQFKIEKVLPS